MNTAGSERTEGVSTAVFHERWVDEAGSYAQMGERHVTWREQLLSLAPRLASLLCLHSAAKAETCVISSLALSPKHPEHLILAFCSPKHLIPAFLPFKPPNSSSRLYPQLMTWFPISSDCFCFLIENVHVTLSQRLLT